MSYLTKNLLPNERLVYRTHLHWIIYVPAIVLIVLGAVVCVEGTQQRDPRWNVGGVGLLIMAFGAVLFVGRWIIHKTSEFGVTDKRVLIKAGLVRRRSLELLLRQVEAVSIEQGIPARLLGYGTIVVTGTGGTKEPFRLIANPMEFRKRVQAQTIIADERSAAATTSAPVDEKTCPQCAEQVKRAAKVCRYCGHHFE